MRSIAIMNQKGGVGKTTTAVNLSAALAASGRRVCLVDLDPQAHASLHLGVSLNDRTLSAYDLLTRDLKSTQIRQRLSENLWLVPSHLNLAAAELELAGMPRRELLLRDRFAGTDSDYDYVICDCPPSLGILTLNALSFVQEVVLPLQPHFLALHGLSKLLQTLQIVAQRLNPGLRLAGIVLCMFDSGTRLAAEVSSDVASFLGNSADSTAWSDAILFATRIRRNIRLAEAPSHGQSVFDYDPKSNGAEDYRRLAGEILATEASSRSFIAMPAA